MNPKQAAGPAPRHILLACTQRIGDVLLATPLARSLKRAWPAAEIDMLVFEGTAGVLAANPDIAQVIAVAPRSGFAANLRLLRQLWRRYDLALTPLPTDRARLYCWAAGRQRLGFLQPRWQERSKALLLNQWQHFDDRDTHSVSMGLRLAQLLGVAPSFDVVPPQLAPQPLEAFLDRHGGLVDIPFCVLHPCPKYRYKMWPQTAWSGLARWLIERGLRVAFTGSAEPAEMDYVDQIARRLPGGVVNLAGTLSLAETAELIRRARLYIGPDTVVTHIAAATGAPTIALFGPSNPVKWGPWPHAWKRIESPWQRHGSARQGNVLLLQGPGDCVPCLHEGCERQRGSRSDCLDALTLEQVTQAAAEMLSG